MNGLSSDDRIKRLSALLEQQKALLADQEKRNREMFNEYQRFSSIQAQQTKELTELCNALQAQQLTRPQPQPQQPAHSAPTSPIVARRAMTTNQTTSIQNETHTRTFECPLSVLTEEFELHAPTMSGDMQTRIARAYQHKCSTDARWSAPSALKHLVDSVLEALPEPSTTLKCIETDAHPDLPKLAFVSKEFLATTPTYDDVIVACVAGDRAAIEPHMQRMWAAQPRRHCFGLVVRADGVQFVLSTRGLLWITSIGRVPRPICGRTDADALTGLVRVIATLLTLRTSQWGLIVPQASGIRLSFGVAGGASVYSKASGLGEFNISPLGDCRVRHAASLSGEIAWTAAVSVTKRSDTRPAKPFPGVLRVHWRREVRAPEAQIYSALAQHRVPYVPRVHVHGPLGKARGTVYAWMSGELLVTDAHGVSVADYARRVVAQPADAWKLVDVAAGYAHALFAASRRRILHGAVAPDCLLVSAEGRALVADWAFGSDAAEGWSVADDLEALLFVLVDAARASVVSEHANNGAVGELRPSQIRSRDQLVSAIPAQCPPLWTGLFGSLYSVLFDGHRTTSGADLDEHDLRAASSTMLADWASAFAVALKGRRTARHFEAFERFASSVRGPGRARKLSSVSHS